MKYFLQFISVFLLASSIMFAQNYNITGFVLNKSTNKGLPYANLRVNKTGRGTATNSEGNYKLKLTQGNYSIIASFIGYKSDTLTFTLSGDKEINFSLIPEEVEIEEVVVNPDRNPAYDIMRKVIKTKNEVKQKIESYKYSSYTKGLIKTTRDFAGGAYSLSTQDTGSLKISGILENQSRGFFKKPDNSKHYIVARKQTANTPPFINILTGGTFLQSFYEDDLDFMGKSIPSPISDEAITYYYFYIEKQLLVDNKKVYQIYFSTDNTAAPGFYGKLFIEDETFHLLKADVRLNQMANPGGLFNYVKVYQQFSVFEDNIALPIDYRLFTEGNYLGLAKFGFELHTIMNSYEINISIDDDFFDNAIISVLPDADKKNEDYWNSIQAIPNTKIETKAYSRIDSITQVAKTFGQDFSFLSPELKINKNFSMTGPISLYSFDKIQGHTLNLGLNYDDAEEQRLNLSGDISYGFSDDLVKKELAGTYRLGDYRTTEISFRAYDELTDLFSQSDNYNKFTSTILSLFTKYDFRDYYYSKGIYFNISSEVFPILKLGAGFISKQDESVNNRSDFSFFYKDKKYSSNKQIYDATVNGIKASFNLDFRKFIEDGFFRRRITPRNNIQLGGNIFHSSNDLFSSDLEFTTFNLKAFGSFITAGNWSLDFYANKFTANKSIPIQWMYALPGNINAGAKNNSFRTLKIGEVYGDHVTTIFLRHNFNDDLFKYLSIPFIENLQIQFATHLNIAISDITDKSKAALIDNYTTFKKPFYELGFSLGHILIPLSFEFTWKLNHRGKNNFAFGINSIAF